jgi:hypothetical protein
MSNAIGAINTLLKADGTLIAEVRSIGGLSLSVKKVDVTTHSSSDPWSEAQATLLDAGDLTFEINYIPTDPTHDNTSGLLSFLTNRTTKAWTLTFPNAGATTWGFDGFISKFDVTAPVDNVLTAKITITATGKPTLV